MQPIFSTMLIVLLTGMSAFSATAQTPSFSASTLDYGGFAGVSLGASRFSRLERHNASRRQS